MYKNLSGAGFLLHNYRFLKIMLESQHDIDAHACIVNS